MTEATQASALLSTSLLPAHPTMVAIRSQLEAINADIVEEARRAVDNLEFEHRTANDRQQLIEASLRRTVGANQAAGDKLVKLRELERNAASDRAIYEAFLNRSNETLEQSTGQFANFRLVQAAEVPTRPSFPPTLKLLILGLLGSLGAGMGLAFLREALVPGFRSGREVADELGVPNLASLPILSRRDLSSWRLRKAPARLVVQKPNSRFAKAISGLRNSLPVTFQFHPQVITTTSAVEGEGKTLIAASLAQDAALRGIKTLLVCDAHDQMLSRAFKFGMAISANGRNGADAADGYEVLEGVFNDRETGLDVLPLAPAEGNKTSDQEYQAVLSAARDAYDFIVIDAGTAGAALEMSRLARDADVTLVVVDWERTPKDTVGETVQLLQRSHAVSIGVVLNRADDFEAMARPCLPAAGELLMARRVGPSRFAGEATPSDATPSFVHAPGRPTPALHHTGARTTEAREP